MTISYPERVSALNKHIGQGTLIRDKYTGTDAKGRETACLLVAIAPEVGPAGRVSNCPASVMPQWMAVLTPFIDDRGSEAAWPQMVRRYAALAADWHLLDADAWSRMQEAARQAAVTVWVGPGTPLSCVYSGWKAAADTHYQHSGATATPPQHQTAVDRMTNLLFDAIEKEIDLAKEEALT